MNNLQEMLKREEMRLNVIVKKIEERLNGAPEGALRVSQSNNKVQYYHLTKNGKYNGVYISKANYKLVQELAQKAYDKKVLECARKRLKQIEKITVDYEEDEIEQVYQKLPEQRKVLVQPIEPVWEQVVRQWQEEKYIPKEFAEGFPVIMSERGERVRSKSEKIIADFLFRNGIAYKYEKPLYLKGYGIVYPDFTILSKKKKIEIYWEHDGRMDDPVYADKAIKKIQCYEENNILMGKNLIITFESSKTVLSTKVLNRILEEL